jgi:hypothetical protein
VVDVGDDAKVADELRFHIGSMVAWRRWRLQGGGNPRADGSH